MKRMAVVALFVVGVVVLAETPGRSNQQVSSPNPNGRFQIVINTNVRADTFLLDTWTGKTWTPVQYTDLQEQPTIWRAMDRTDNDAALAGWLNMHQAIAK